MRIKKVFKRIFLKNEVVFFKRTLLGSIVFTVSTVVSADMKSSYEAGESFAGSLKDLPKESISEIKMTEVPGFKTEMPPQSHVNKNGNFEEAIHQSMNDSEAGKNIIENAKNRQRFEIDPQTDPLFKVYDKESAEEMLAIKNNPEKIEEQGTDQQNCDEGGDEILENCNDTLYVNVTKTIKHVPVRINLETLYKKWLVHMGTFKENDIKHWGYLSYHAHCLPLEQKIERLAGVGESGIANPAYFKKIVCPILKKLDANLNDLDCDTVK
jgi:hypothetical protein